MKQKVISGDMCGGGDIREMPVVQKKGKKQPSGERALSWWEGQTKMCFLDCHFFVSLGISSILSLQVETFNIYRLSVQVGKGRDEAKRSDAQSV